MSENLAKARAAVSEILRQDTGADHPKWRVIITDSESPTGVAPVCTGERSDAWHMIEDYPGGPKRDEDGVYDCCPWPQFDTYSVDVAAYLVELLNADAEQASDSQPAVAPDFFEVGRTYEYQGDQFRVLAVDPHPATGVLTAIGWLIETDGTCLVIRMTAGNWETGKWTEVTA